VGSTVTADQGAAVQFNVTNKALDSTLTSEDHSYGQNDDDWNPGILGQRRCIG
jgi:hypothetical protein